MYETARPATTSVPHPAPRDGTRHPHEGDRPDAGGHPGSNQPGIGQPCSGQPGSGCPPWRPESSDTENATLRDEIIEPVHFQFDLSRREFVSTLGAGLLITVMSDRLFAQRSGRDPRGGRSRGGFGRSEPVPVAARVHIGQDGTITVMTGKVEAGQGARAELTQAAAEELRVPAERVQLIMADTALVPNDGITAGSRSTPSTVPAIRQGCAAARDLLIAIAAEQWKVGREALNARDSKVVHTGSGREAAYGELAADPDAARAFKQVPADVEVTPVKQWQTMGVSVPRPNGRDLVTGQHRFPSDIRRPGMLYGRILRPPAYESRLSEIDLAPAKAMEGVIVVRDGDFVGVAAPTRFAAEKAIAALEKTAKWQRGPHVASSEMYEHLRRHANVPDNPHRSELNRAAHRLRQTYCTAYIQHAPLEPRAAVAEWQDGKLTVWTATQNPFGVRSELARAFRLDESDVRVIVPDFGAGFGGKHTGETAVEAARLSKEAKRPVSLCWTRTEEFTWAAFRPAAVMDLEASLDDQGRITSWYHVNINAGGSGVRTPYAIAKNLCESVSSQPPLRHGSYRALAATANNFARESFMDELAALARQDPLAFRLAHIEDPRLRAVLEKAATEFDWPARVKRRDPRVGVGLSCGVEKGSCVATCAEIAIDDDNTIHVRHVCQAYECGAIINPENLLSQVRGCIIMGLGPALREAMEFEDGRILNASFRAYEVPRFADVPTIDVHLLNRRDLTPVGAGETPIIGIAPAIGNAVYHATGRRLGEMPMRL